MARLALVSYRLGGSDGVSIEAAKWIAALESLGHEVLTVAGAGVADHLVDGLGLSDDHGPSPGALSMLEDVELTIVENVASLPLNPYAREALYDVLGAREAIWHHHDLAWQRPATAHLEGPRDEDHWSHVVINALSRSELAERGIAATLLYNRFDCEPPRGEREATRARLDVAPGENLALFPSRAIARKNIAAALELCEALPATLWLLGPPEDGYEEELDELLGRTSAKVLRGDSAARSVHDAYAASDLVVVSSSWEGFGNPVLESVTHRRPLALSHYPVAEEIRGFGFEFFDLHDVATLREELITPDYERRAANAERARAHFNLADLPGDLASSLKGHGLLTPVG